MRPCSYVLPLTVICALAENWARALRPEKDANQNRSDDREQPDDADLSNYLARSVVRTPGHGQGEEQVQHPQCDEPEQQRSANIHREWDLTFDMSGDRKPAQPAGGRPLDGGVRCHAAEL